MGKATVVAGMLWVLAAVLPVSGAVYNVGHTWDRRADWGYANPDTHLSDDGVAEETWFYRYFAHAQDRGFPAFVLTTLGQWYGNPRVWSVGPNVPPMIAIDHMDSNVGAGQPSVLVWKSPVEGTIRVQGTMSVTNNNGDSFMFLRNSLVDPLASGTVGNQGSMPVDFTARVFQGDIISLYVHSNVSGGWLGDSFTITYLEEAPQPAYGYGHTWNRAANWTGPKSPGINWDDDGQTPDVWYYWGYQRNTDWQATKFPLDQQNCWYGQLGNFGFDRGTGETPGNPFFNRTSGTGDGSWAGLVEWRAPTDGFFEISGSFGTPTYAYTDLVINYDGQYDLAEWHGLNGGTTPIAPMNVFLQEGQSLYFDWSWQGSPPGGYGWTVYTDSGIQIRLVPEPATLALLGGGLLVLARRRRR